MLPAEANAVVAKQLMVPGSKAATANCSGEYISVSDAVGDILVLCDVGNVSGSVQGALWTASSTGGASATTVLFEDGATFDNADVSNVIQAKVLNANNQLGFIRYVGTVTSGPVSMGVSIIYRPRWTS